MANSSVREIYFSFFMFTADLKPNDREYTKKIVEYIHKLGEMGYTGFDLPIAPGATTDHRAEIESYTVLRQALDDAGLRVRFTTNVAVTRTFDPSSMYKEQRDVALAYLKSRVDITKALRADIMAGPIILPYGVFPMTDANQPIWSDDLHQWLIARYRNAKPIIEELGEYAGEQGVKVAVEPVDHWETPAPNMVREVMQFVESVSAPSVGVCIDSAHVVLGSHGPSAFAKDACHALEERRLHYVHISAPDRGAVHDSWIPWGLFLRPILDRYTGPLLVEVFNAIPVFLNSLRLTRRKFWVPGEDTPEADRPSAFDIARRAIEAVHHEVGQGART